jgi:catechol 2,3-dioxygenase-like lactoylglutathione lyase family enzyme
MIYTNPKVHISLNVKHINESVRFYQKMFDVKPVKHFGDYAKFDVTSPSLNLVLNQTDFSGGGSLSHLGVQVFSTDEVLATRDKWIKSGLLTLDEMQVDCCYAKQDKTWVKDPDGNEWEVFVVLDDVPEDEMNGTESSCCQPKLNGVGKQVGSVQNCC